MNTVCQGPRSNFEMERGGGKGLVSTGDWTLGGGGGGLKPLFFNNSF